MMQNVIDSFLVLPFRLKLTWIVALHMPKSFSLGSVENDLLISGRSISKQNPPHSTPKSTVTAFV